MPHCVIECPTELQNTTDLSMLVRIVYDAAIRSDLFEDGDIKARVILTNHSVVGGTSDPFVHVTTHILEGRKPEQKNKLASGIATSLCKMLPQIKMISVEVRDIQKSSYANRSTVTQTQKTSGI